MGIDLTTLAQVKQVAGITSTDDDAAIGEMISAASALIASKLLSDYSGDPVTERISGGTSCLILSQNAAAITSVSVDGGALVAADYEIDAQAPRCLYRMSGVATSTWSAGVRNVLVVYTPPGDGNITGVPEDLRLAVAMVVAFVVKQTGLESGGARLGLGSQANSDTGQADYFAKAIADLPYVREVLTQHKRLF